jgi:hypothetical protein
MQMIDVAHCRIVFSYLLVGPHFKFLNFEFFERLVGPHFECLND